MLIDSQVVAPVNGAKSAQKKNLKHLYCQYQSRERKKKQTETKRREAAKSHHFDSSAPHKNQLNMQNYAHT